MMKFLRSQSQSVLVIVLGVIGLGFLFYGNSGNLLTSPGGHVNNDYGKIDGEDLSIAELYDAIHTTRDSLILTGHAQELRQAGARAQLAEEAWRQLLLLHAADRLHIQVSDEDLVNYIHNQAIFQKDGAYSPEAYQDQMAQLQKLLRLPADSGPDPLANTKAAFETTMRNNLRSNAVSNALFSTVHASAQEVSNQYEKFYGPADISYVVFDPKSFSDAAQVTPDEIAAEYKAHPEKPEYRTKEKRKVDYVLFPLTPEQTKLPAADKTAAIEALGEKALDFALAFQPDPAASAGATPPALDFLAEGKKRGLNTATSDFFATDTPPANLPPSPAFNSAAFALTPDNPISKVVTLDNGVAVLHLAEIQPSDLLPIDQVKDGITKQLRQAKGEKAAEDAAKTASQSLKTAVAKGTDFKTAAAGLHLKLETLPAFVPIKASDADTKLKTIADVVTILAVGQVSQPIPIFTDNTTLVLHVDNRAKPDPAGIADFENRFRSYEEQQLRMLVYIDWANWMSKQPGTHKPPDLEAYGGIE